jgi:hypothetical protein
MKSAGPGICFRYLMITACGAVASARADETFRWKFAVGQTRHFVLTERKDTQVVVNGKKLPTSFAQTTFMTWKVKSVDKDGIAQLMQTIDRVKFQMRPTFSRKKFDVDTAKDRDAEGTPDEFSELFRSMVGSEFTTTMTARGEFRDVKVPAKLVEAFARVDPRGEGSGHEEILRTMFSNAFVIFPSAAIGQESFWTMRRRLPVPFGAGLVMDSTYYPVKGEIKPVQSFALAGKAKVEPKEGSKLEITVQSQDQTGQCRFDNVAGVLETSEVAQKISMALKLGPHSVAFDLEWTLRLEFEDDRAIK